MPRETHQLYKAEWERMKAELQRQKDIEDKEGTEMEMEMEMEWMNESSERYFFINWYSLFSNSEFCFK